MAQFGFFVIVFTFVILEWILFHQKQRGEKILNQMDQSLHNINRICQED